MKLIILISFLLFLHIPFATFAYKSNVDFLHFGTDDGLSNSDPTCVVQDHDGFIWVGTNDGLNRFDGTNFKVYRKQVKDTTTLLHNSISVLFVDKLGQLWVGTTNGGLCKYDKLTDRFIQYLSKGSDVNTLIDNSISSITQDIDGNIWVATFWGLNKYIANEDKFERYTYNPNLEFDCNSINKLNEAIPNKKLINELNQFVGKKIATEQVLSYLSSVFLSDTIEKYQDLIRNYGIKTLNNKSIADYHIRLIVPDKEGNIWIGYSRWIISKFNPQTGAFTHYPNNKEENLPFEDFYISSLSITKEKLWVGTRGDGVWWFDLRKSEWIKFDQITDNFINTIAIDSENEIWIGGANCGLVNYSPLSGTINFYKHDVLDNYSLSTNSILKIYEDQKRNLWICNIQGGLDLIVYNNPFHSLRESQNKSIGLTSSNVSSVLKDREGNLWIGFTAGGVDVIEKNTNTKRHYTSGVQIGKGTVSCFHEDRNGNIWIGTYLGGMQKYDPQTGKITTFIHKPDNQKSIAGNNIRKITEDQQGNLWIAIHGAGVDKLNRKEMIFEHHRVDYNNFNASISNDWVFTVYCDDNGKVWIGSVYGVSVIDEKSTVVKKYVHEPGNDKSLSSNLIMTIFKDSKKRFWFGTPEGLNLMDSQTETFRSFSTSDGLINENISGIIEDNEQNLWITTYKGLSCLSLSDFTFKNYINDNGLITDEFGQAAICKSENGELFFGGRQGLNYFFPQNIKQNNYIPKVYLTKFSLFNTPVDIHLLKKKDGIKLKKQISYENEIILPYKQNVITFEFAALNFSFSKKNEYAYMLEGFDKDWNYTKEKNNVTFTNLPPGKYNLLLKTGNINGAWSEKPTTLKLIILPPWWRTKLSLSLYIVFIIILLTWFRFLILNREKIKAKIAYEKLDAQKTHELDLMKIQFFTNISHEFKTPLTLIMGPLEKLRENLGHDPLKQYVDLISRNANQLLRLINQLMDFRKIEVGALKLNLQNVDLLPIVRAIFQSFEYEAQMRHIKYKLVPDGISFIGYFDRDKIEKILINLLSNAFKFVNNHGTITLIVREIPPTVLKTSAIEIIVEDDGIGIDPVDLPLIFDQFYQQAVSKDTRGTGIGLALVKEYIALHKGVINVNSAKNKGTKFSLIIPSSLDDNSNDLLTGTSDMTLHYTSVVTEEQPVNSLNSELPIENDESKPILLIIEDNLDIRQYIRIDFEQHFTIIEAENGEMGLDMAMNELPDCIISDVMMPKIGGFELCEQLKNNDLTSHIPIVLLTARTLEKNIIEGLTAGADDYITKPFSLSVLMVRVKNLIQLRRNLAKKYAQTKKANVYPEISVKDDQYLKKLIVTVEENLSNPDFDATALSNVLFLSRSQLYRKVRAVTGQSVHEFIRNVRLKKAAELLTTTDNRVSEVAFMVGFNSVAYFTSSFTSFFGVPPSKYTSNSNLG
jgi:signal transduction histidine kinase/ligand-binding sensor domain-containing protein/DNA-binding response OmpR family regulator